MNIAHHLTQRRLLNLWVQCNIQITQISKENHINQTSIFWGSVFMFQGVYSWAAGHNKNAYASKWGYHGHHRSRGGLELLFWVPNPYRARHLTLAGTLISRAEGLCFTSITRCIARLGKTYVLFQKRNKLLPCEKQDCVVQSKIHVIFQCFTSISQCSIPSLKLNGVSNKVSTWHSNLQNVWF